MSFAVAEATIDHHTAADAEPQAVYGAGLTAWPCTDVQAPLLWNCRAGRRMRRQPGSSLATASRWAAGDTATWTG